MTVEAEQATWLAANHPWMSPTTIAALSSGGMSNDTLANAANAAKNVLLQGWDGFAHVHDDPVLSKQPTQALQLRANIQNTVNTYPANAGDVQEIQGSLQGLGFGAGLPTGVWDQAWNEALHNYTAQRIADQYAGQQPSHGSVSVHTILHGILHALSPSGAFNAIIGTIKALPGDVRSLVADTVGGFAAGEQQLSQGNLLGLANVIPGVNTALQAAGVNRGSSWGSAAGSTVESFLRAKGHLSAADYAQRLGIGHLVNDVSTVLALVPVAGEGSTAAKAMGRSVLRRDAEASLGEAARAGGVISSSLFKPTLAVERNPGVLARMAYKGTADNPEGGLFGQQWVRNIPILGRTGPWVGKLIGQDGAYYRARTLLAYPYRYPAVAAVGNATGKAMLVGAGLRLSADAEQALGVNGDTANAILKEHTVPGWVDWTAFLLHPTPGSVGAPSRALADKWDRFRATLNLSPIGVKAAMDDALRTFHGHTGLGAQDWTDLVRQVGSEDKADLWLRMVFADHAAAAKAEDILKAGTDSRFAHLQNTPYGDETTAALQTLSHETIWLNPELHAKAAAELASRPDTLTARFYKEIANHYAQGGDIGGRINDFLEAGQALRDIRAAGNDKLLITPASMQQQNDAYNELKAEQALGNGGLTTEQGSERLFGRVTNLQDLFDEVGTAQWRKANIEQPLGAIGVARKDTLDRTQAYRDAKKFDQRLEQAKAVEDPDQQLAAINQVNKDAADYLFTHFGMDARRLAALHAPDKLVDWIRERAGNLAVPVFPPKDAPQALLDKLGEVDRRGFKVVFGTDIGHAWSDSLPDLGDLGSAVSRGRKAARMLGLSLETFDPRESISAIKYANVRIALQNAVEAGKVKLPPYYTVDTLLRDLTDDNLVPNATLPLSQRIAFQVGLKSHLSKARLAADLQGLTEKDVTDALKAELVSGLGLRDLRLRTFHDVLGRTKNVPWVTDLAKGAEENTIPLLDKASIANTYRAVQEGLASTPTYMVGLGKLDDVARRMIAGPLGVPLVSKVGDRFPNAAAVLEGLPPRLMNALLRYRFTISPMYSLRRQVKTNLKIGVEGVDPVWNPLAVMARKGTFAEDKALLDRVFPEAGARATELDNVLREFAQSDAYGIFNARYHEMYTTGELKRQGLSDAEVRRKIIRIFTYGTKDNAGQTALERSINTVFFPFSFTRTLYRNIGGYLIDRPVQLLAIAAGVNFWHTMGSQSAVGKWFEDRLPILREIQALNAFAHGVSLGEIGGVYAPGLNLFLPQHYSSFDNAVAGFQAIMPVLRDFNREFVGFDPKTGKRYAGGGDVWEQARILKDGITNAGQSVLADLGWMSKPGAFEQRQPGITASSQLDAAYAMRNALIARYHDALAWNERASSSANEYHFPDDPRLPTQIRGQAITKTAIGELVHLHYPAFDPSSSQKAAIAGQQQIDSWLAQVAQREPGQYDAYKAFVDRARQVATYINDGRYTDQQAADTQNAFRAYAASAAANDPSFRSFYAKQFAWLFGPLSLSSKDTR